MNYIEFARRARGWSQVQLAAITRVDQQHISQLERGITRGSADQRSRIAKELDLPADRLFDEVPRPVLAPADLTTASQ